MPQPESAHRQTSSSSASGASRRRSVGCMAGLLRLLSPYHRSHHRKRLTAKNSMPVVCTPPPSPPPLKKRLPAAVAAPSPSPSPLPSSAQTQQQQPAPTAILRRRSCDAPRSPTIAPEHRRASCDSPRPTSPAIVARLMGLEESAPPSPALQATRRLPTRPPPPPPPPDTAAEKRRKLLGALEKCDEDLKTLRRIIAAVRAAEMRASTASSDAPVPERAAGKGEDKSKDGRAVNPSPSPSPSPSPTAQKPRSEEQYPSPDSVLDAITSPRFPCRKRSSPCTDHDADHKPSGGISAVRSKIVKPSRTLVFSGDYCKIKPCNELHAVAMYHHPVVATVEAIPRWMPPAVAGEAEIIWRHRRRWGLEAAASGRSRAMAESVGEVWGQTAGEESREAARVGAALERAILHDLVGDAVAELLAHSMPPHPCRHGDVAAGAAAMCKKRLVFGAS